MKATPSSTVRPERGKRDPLWASKTVDPHWPHLLGTALTRSLPLLVTLTAEDRALQPGQGLCAQMMLICSLLHFRGCCEIARQSGRRKFSDWCVSLLQRSFPCRLQTIWRCQRLPERLAGVVDDIEKASYLLLTCFSSLIHTGSYDQRAVVFTNKC